jgi:hypothetical protein
MKRFELAGITVEVDVVGTGESPGAPGHTVDRYEVVVSDGGHEYRCDGWGSVRDHAAGREDHVGIARCVISELLWWGDDPDEFLACMLDGGRKLTVREFRRLARAVDALGEAREWGLTDAVADAVNGYEIDELWDDDEDGDEDGDA